MTQNRSHQDWKTSSPPESSPLEFDEARLEGWPTDVDDAIDSPPDPALDRCSGAVKTVASNLFTRTQEWQKAQETVTQLETALISRSHIDMAKGAIIGIHGCDPDCAFARLTDESQRRNIKLRDNALELLAQMQTKS